MAPGSTGATPFDDGELYDAVFDALEFDVPCWLALAREARGPVLEVGCGTGRILLRLLAAGIDADGVDLHAPMLERARRKADAAGFSPKLVRGDMKSFAMGRRYTLAICAFNSFAHALDDASRVATLQRIREHLEPGGRLALHLSLPRAEFWAQADGAREMEIEVKHPVTGLPIRLWDTRTLDRETRTQRSLVEYQELDARGEVARSHRSETWVRWTPPEELADALGRAGFTEWTFFGGYDEEPLTAESPELVAIARR